MSGCRLSFSISSPFLGPEEDMPLEQVKNEEQAGQTQRLHTDAAMEQGRPQQVGFVWPCYPGLQSFRVSTGALAQVISTKWTLISGSANGLVPAIIKKKRLDPKKHFYCI